MSYSDKQTEAELQKLQKEIEHIYNKAYLQIEKIIAEYMAKFEKRDEKMREELKNPEAYKKKYCVGASAYMTPEQHYKQWRLAQIGRGKRWEAVKKNIANVMVDANKKAQDVINSSLAKIYGINYNFSAYEIEKGSGIAFNIFDENTINNLLKGENHTNFRTVRVDPKRDYAWNSKRIQDALTSGILQGYSIPKITDSFMQVMQNNRAAAIRNARTAVTSAQNAGREETFKEAQAMGIEIEQEWLSAHDGRVRDSHAELDGVRIPVGGKFPNGCRYPGDPQGRPAEVYNCRCTIRAILPKYNGKARTNKTVDSYNEWLKEKKRNRHVKN